MPTWQPNWDNVRFDFAAAESAIADCRAARLALDQREALFRRPRNDALAQWRGRSRQSFDLTDRALQMATGALMAHLWQAEQRLANAIHDARTEQTRRVRDRERWQREDREERVRASAVTGRR